jgi:thiamine-phosphate pyrophosphorylase
MRSLNDCRLYGIVDLGYVTPGDVPAMTRKLIEGGVDILQLRAKTLGKREIASLAREMLLITRDAGVPLVINDHLEVAAEVGSEGVHIGQDDGSVAAARAVVGASCFVGKSTHSLAQAVAAQAEGADAIGLGDIGEVHRRVSVPIFCIGGVNQARLPEVLAAGARRVVIVSAFLQAANVSESVRAVKRALGAKV